MNKDFNNKKKIINACCAWTTKDGIWFVHEALAVLMYYNIKIGEVTDYVIIPCDDVYTFWSFGSIWADDNRVYLFADNQPKSFIYEIKAKVFSEILTKGEMGFGGLFVYGNTIYAISYKNGDLIKISTDNFEIENGVGWKSAGVDGGLHINMAIKCKDYIFCTVPKLGGIIFYNLKENNWGRKDISPNTDYSYIACSDNNLYIYDTMNAKIIKTDLNLNVIKEKKLEISSLKLIFSKENNLIIDDISEERIVIWNDNLEEISSYEFEYSNSSLRSGYHGAIWSITNDCIYGISQCNKIYIFDSINGMSIYDLSMSDLLWNKMANELKLNRKEPLKESELFPLQDFISSLM